MMYLVGGRYKVSEHEKSDIEARMEKVELAIDKLIGYFDSCGYNRV